MNLGRFVPIVHGAALDRPDEQDTVLAAQAVAASLEAAGYHAEILALGTDLSPLDALAQKRPHLIFNLVEALGAEGVRAVLVPEALERLGLDFTGARAAAWRATSSKVETKRRLAQCGLPTPPWIGPGDTTRITGRVIVKSDEEHASLGLDAASVIDSVKSAEEIMRREARFGGRFFAEAYIEGREFNLSLIEGEAGPELLPIAEIDFVDYPPDRPRIVDYEAKWIEGSFAHGHTPRRFRFPDEDLPLLRRLEALALATWRAFDLQGYVRVDFRVDAQGNPWILEVNVNPCLTPDAGFPAAASEAGMDYDAMVARIMRAAAKSRRRAA